MNNIERTVISSVVFLDIVGYSKEPVEDQMQWKKELNRSISKAISNLKEEDRVILDTGDGAALCFLTDPEMALVAAINLLDGLKTESGEWGEMKLRIGINLGAVKIVQDINGQKNVVGDAINVGQRVMSFAKPNQILASRSFYDVVSCLTKHYKNIFVFHGLHKDKHVREHEVYEVRALNPGEPEPVEEKPQPPNPIPVCEVVFSPEILGQLESLLKSHIGPMAKVLIKSSEKSVTTLHDLCETLSKHVPSESERVRFLGKALSIIGGGTTGAASNPPSQSPGAVPQLKAFTVNNLILEAFEREFMLSVGPMAKIIIKKELTNATSAKHLLDLLAAKIPDEKERERFIQKVSKHVR